MEKNNCENCEMAGNSGVTTTKNIWANNPFGNTGCRQVFLCDNCYDEWELFDKIDKD